MVVSGFMVRRHQGVAPVQRARSVGTQAARPPLSAVESDYARIMGRPQARVLSNEEDAHERAHADDIDRRSANREMSTGQIFAFGLTDGPPTQATSRLLSPRA